MAKNSMTKMELLDILAILEPTQPLPETANLVVEDKDGKRYQFNQLIPMLEFISKREETNILFKLE